jgi:leader peptidase (prepilin peptidase)/N-methyltransferase
VADDAAQTAVHPAGVNEESLPATAGLADTADAAPASERMSPPTPRHPLLGATIAALTVLSFAVFGFEPEAVIAAFAAGALAVLAAIDIEHRVLPNRILYPSLAVVLVAQVAVAPDRAVEWLLAGLAAAAFLGLPLLVRRDAMGMGDIKLALLLGAVVGWKVFGAIVIGCIAMLPFALAMLLRDGSIRGATLPFGPFLAFGTLLLLFTS